MTELDVVHRLEASLGLVLAVSALVGVRLKLGANGARRMASDGALAALATLGLSFIGRVPEPSQRAIGVALLASWLCAGLLFARPFGPERGPVLVARLLLRGQAIAVGLFLLGAWIQRDPAF